VYVTGWIKRGPSGVIGTNKKDATETVEVLLADLREGPRKDRPADEIEALLAERGTRFVLYPGWTSIDEVERAAGEKLGRPRVKLVTWGDLLEAANRIADTPVH
jgi:ferredoxin--NADP+ reductase